MGAEHTFRRYRFLGSIVFFCTVLGCHHSNPPTPIHHSSLTTHHSPTLSPNQRVGVVTWVSETDNTLVIELDPYLEIPVGGRLIARLENSSPKGVLQLTSEGHGHYRPALLLAGTTAPGDEVIAPGPKLRAWGDTMIDQ